jgi:hypothetical protein
MTTPHATLEVASPIFLPSEAETSEIIQKQGIRHDLRLMSSYATFSEKLKEDWFEDNKISGYDPAIPLGMGIKMHNWVEGSGGHSP